MVDLARRTGAVKLVRLRGCRACVALADYRRGPRSRDVVIVVAAVGVVVEVFRAIQ